MSKLSQVTAHDCVAQSDDLSQLDKQVLEHRLGDLIRRYVRGRSTVLAYSVVRHIEALIRHPDVRDPALFCSAGSKLKCNTHTYPDGRGLAHENGLQTVDG
jgi:hypothetical protein